MSLIQCDVDCVYQKDGYCSLEMLRLLQITQVKAVCTAFGFCREKHMNQVKSRLLHQSIKRLAYRSNANQFNIR